MGDVTGLVERAREAAWSVATDPATPGKNIPLETPEDIAEARACSDAMSDAALLAALDPEDNDLLVAVSLAISEHNGLPYSNLTIEGRQARAVIEYLRKQCGENT